MNCIWITTDSFRQDHVNCYRPEGTIDDTGDSLRVRTPHLDRLATESLMVKRLRAEALPTIPCRRGVFTGRRVFPWTEEAFHKGIYIHLPGWRPVPQQEVTVAEHLSEHGYVTAFFADTYHMMKPSMNFHRGFQCFHWERGQEFDQWQTTPLPEGHLEQHLKPEIPLGPARTRVLAQFLRNHLGVSSADDLPVGRTFTQAIRWLEGNAAHDKFFLYIDTFSPHEPWLPPKGLVDSYDPDYQGADLVYGNPYRRDQLSDREHHRLRCRYAAGCTLVDSWIGKLLQAVDRLGLRERTLVILMSDHGKIIGEFGHYGMPAQDMSTMLGAVPCFVRHPSGMHAGESFEDWVFNTDLTATMLAMLDAPPKPGVDGQDLWPAVGCGPGDFRDHAVTAFGQIVATWQDDWLALADTDTGTKGLFNVAEDVFRQHDVSAQYPSVRDDLLSKLEATLAAGQSRDVV